VLLPLKILECTIHQLLELSRNRRDWCDRHRVKDKVNDSARSQLDHSCSFALGRFDLHDLFDVLLVLCHGKDLLSDYTLNEVLRDQEFVSIRLCFVN